jgi:hypothetical protein
MRRHHAVSHTDEAEYPLPFRVEDLCDWPQLDPWLARFSRLTQKQVSEILREEWDAIRTSPVASFRDAILSFQPISLFYDGSKHDDWYRGWWLRMERPATEDDWETEVFLHAPPDKAALIKCLSSYGLPERDVMTELYFHFYKLRNFKDNGSAFFEPPWFQYQNGGWYDDVDDDHPDPLREWAEAYYLYATAAGDKVLMKANGEVGWALAAERRMCPLASSFSSFIEQCAICYRDQSGLEYYRWREQF